MRKITVILLMTILPGTIIMSQSIANSAHDFSGDSWNPSGETCITCHTPHNADIGVTDAPLWNHEVTQATFTVYSSTTLDATTGQPTGVSKLCLSCHDGTVAIDNYGGKTNGTNTIGSGESIGTDLSGEHPVSFTYDATLATSDGELFDPTSVNSGLGSTIDSDLLVGNKMECSSCHDVHNTIAVANTKLLVKSNVASALCFTCHDK